MKALTEAQRAELIKLADIGEALTYVAHQALGHKQYQFDDWDDFKNTLDAEIGRLDTLNLS